MKYRIEFELPDNDTVLRNIKTADVSWAVWGYNGYTKAKPVQEWIQCSERLPKVGEDVLFSVADMFVAEGCLRDDGNWWQFRWETVQLKKHVIAWMPLPEPYREDGGE